MWDCPSPHAWASSKLTALIRCLVLLEYGGIGGLESEKRELWLFHCLSPAWTKPGDRIAFTAAPTEFGPLSASMVSSETGASIRMRGNFHTPFAAYRIRVPYFKELVSFAADAKAKQAEDGCIVLSPDATKLDIVWKDRPGAHGGAFEDILTDYRNTDTFDRVDRDGRGVHSSHEPFLLRGEKKNAVDPLSFEFVKRTFQYEYARRAQLRRRRSRWKPRPCSPAKTGGRRLRKSTAGKETFTHSTPTMKSTVVFAVLSCFPLAAIPARAFAVSAAAVANPSRSRCTGRGRPHRVRAALHADAFIVETISQQNGKDVFEIESRNGKIVLRGNNGVSIAVAFNWYLRYTTKTNYDWQATGPLQIKGDLPLPTGSTRQSCTAKERFFLNYCTYGYTMPWWNWDQWQRFIDWMAMNGVNRPLMQAGVEAVWLEVWKSYGLKDEQIRGYFGALRTLPWHRMANHDGWDHPLPVSYVEGQRQLQKQILARARGLGMKTILSGFAGHVPEFCGPSSRMSKSRRSSRAGGAWTASTPPGSFRPPIRYSRRFRSGSSRSRRRSTAPTIFMGPTPSTKLPRQAGITPIWPPSAKPSMRAWRRVIRMPFGIKWHGPLVGPVLARFGPHKSHDASRPRGKNGVPRLRH